MKDFKECWESENEPVVKGNNAVKETKKMGLVCILQHNERCKQCDNAEE